MTVQALEITRSSASMLGTKTGLRKAPVVAKYHDTSICIGCKACEAACQQWNDLKTVATQQSGTYQTLPALDAQFWNLIRFNERTSKAGDPIWLMRKDQCMHCAEPGCLAACPAPGAIVQYSTGIVDVDAAKCIGCGYCATGCPFNVPKFHAVTAKMAKCTLCVDRVEVGLEPACVKACPTGSLQFGTKDDVLAMANRRVKQLETAGFSDAMIYDPPGVQGTGVVSVLAHGNPEWYGLPADPQVSVLVRLWKSVIRPLGVIAALGALVATVGHYTKYGPKQPAESDVEERP